MVQMGMYFANLTCPVILSLSPNLCTLQTVYVYRVFRIECNLLVKVRETRDGEPCFQQSFDCDVADAIAAGFSHCSSLLAAFQRSMRKVALLITDSD
jgi:hypothetical protein